MPEEIVEAEEQPDIFFQNIVARVPADTLVRPWSLRRTISGIALMVDFAAQQFRRQPLIDPLDIRMFADSVDLLLNCSADVPSTEIRALQRFARESRERDGKSYRIHPGYRVCDAPHSSYRALDLSFGMDAFYSMLSYYIAEAKNRAVRPCYVYGWIDFTISREIQPWRDRNASQAAILVMLAMRTLRDPIQRLPLDPVVCGSPMELERIYASL